MLRIDLPKIDPTYGPDSGTSTPAALYFAAVVFTGDDRVHHGVRQENPHVVVATVETIVL